MMDTFAPRFAGLTAQALSPQAIWVEDWARFIVTSDTTDFCLSDLAQACCRYQPNSDHRTLPNHQVAVKWLMGRAVKQIEGCCAQTLLGVDIDTMHTPRGRAQRILDRIEAFYSAPLPMALVGFLAPHVADFAAWDDAKYPCMGIDGCIQDYLTLWCTTLEAVLEPLVGKNRARDLTHHSLVVLYSARCMQGRVPIQARFNELVPIYVTTGCLLRKDHDDDS